MLAMQLSQLVVTLAAPAKAAPVQDVLHGEW